MSAVVATAPRSAGFVAGTRAMLPLAIGCAPFGVAVGATIADSDVDVAPTLAASLLMFGGSAQLAVVQMLGAGAAPLVILTAAVMINLRFVAYSAALAPPFPTSGRVSRAAMAATLVDQTYLGDIDRRHEQRPGRARARAVLRRRLGDDRGDLGGCAGRGVLAGSLLPRGGEPRGGGPDLARRPDRRGRLRPRLAPGTRLGGDGRCRAVLRGRPACSGDGHRDRRRECGTVATSPDPGEEP